MTEQQKANLSKGKQFSSDYQPENTGRRKSKLKGIIESNDLSSADISDLIINLFDKTEEELEIIKSDQEQPYLLRAFVKAMLKDIEGDSLYNVNSLLDRAIGKAINKEEVEHTTLDKDGNKVGMDIKIEFTGD